MRFEGKNVIVTGAASGIGRATAILFASEGAQVTIADINEDGLAETADMMSVAPKITLYDAADNDSCKALISAATDGHKLDVLCNIAGMLDWAPTPDFSEERFERVVRVNLFSVYTLCRAALPHLIESKGNIVNMASTAALQGIPYSLAYAASKHAVAGITKSLAIEMASQGVRVNAVCPGHVNTPMGNTPPPAGDIDWALMMRNAPKLVDGMCEPLDIAEMVAYLASEQGRKISGALFTVDGGQLAG
jgi:meso-butanediol dehydrogenase / (S,S)-butanediol dehydrogenase / diacetyl reductase